MKTIQLSMTRLYLLPEKSGSYTLIDTGYAHEYDLFLKKLSRRGIETEHIAHLFLTHYHDDHSGFLARLLCEDPQITVVARAETEPLPAAGKTITARGGSLLNCRIRALFKLKEKLSPNWDLTFPPVSLRSRDIRLKGERNSLEKLGLEAEALSTPGHSCDSQSILCADGRLFCGDMAARFLNFTGALYCTLFNEEIETVYRSWRKVLDLGARRIYPAHGRDFAADKLERHMNVHRRSSVVPFK